MNQERANIDGTGVTIGFFDSGVGGLAYVPAIRTLLPRARLRYLADNECFPYGTRSDESVSQIVLERVARLIAACAPDIVVVACNTASVVALEALRLTFPAVVFVGVVPAVKPAAAASRTGRIGVLATNRTVSAAYLDSLVAEFAQGLVVERIAGGEIVQFVETGLPHADVWARQEVVRETAGRFTHAAVDTVVLGCTHFLHLEEEFARALGPEVTVIDSRQGVARRVRALVEEGDHIGRGSEAGRDLFFTTEPAERYSWFAGRFGFEYAGVIANVRAGR
ncbi:MAG: glutamate racemase [Spirochaetota bacterium]